MGETLRRTYRRALVAVLAGAIALAVAAPAVFAHSFLIRTSPDNGSRLDRSPNEVVLDFTEPVGGDSTLTLRDASGETVELLSVGVDEATRVRASLPELADGVYRVTWRAIPDDGHPSEGEFVFAVGVDLPPAAVVSGARRSGAVLWPDAIVALTMLGGLAIALGGLLSERFVWRHGQASISAQVTGAVAVALVGAIGAMALIVDRADVVGDPSRWAQAFTTRSDRAAIGIAAALSVALLVVQRRRVRSLALLPLAAAGVLLVTRGHAPDATGWWTTPAAAAHLLIAGAWVGALVHLAATARHARSAESLEPGPSRYASAAIVAAVTTLVIGGIVALGQIDRLGDLTATTYGRLLLLKVGLVGVALLVALLARTRAIPAEGERVARLARYSAIETTVLIAVLAASALLSTTEPARGLGVIELGPAPLPERALLTADLAGSHEVLVAAAEDRLEIRVLPPGGQPGVDQTATFAGVEPDGTAFDLAPRTCGPGCFEIAHRWTPGVTQLIATVANPAADGGTARLEITWPPGPERSDLLGRAIAATGAAGEVVVTETISSGPAATVGPGDLAITGAIYISSSPFSAGADRVRQLPDEDGLTVITFTVSGAGTWHQLWIDDDDRIRRETLVDPGHRIDRVITYVDEDEEP